jgi:hypothetical protein
MKIQNKVFQTILLLLSLTVAGSTMAAGLGTNIAVRLVGTATADPSGQPFDDFDLPIPDDVVCFDLDLVDIKSGKVIGVASDCLSGIDDSDAPGLALTGTTFFHFPGGSLVTQGLTSVRPVSEIGGLQHGSADFTHITGAIPTASENSVLAGTGKFKKVHGTARLSGAVNLSDLTANGNITFDCMFILNVGRGK